MDDEEIVFHGILTKKIMFPLHPHGNSSQRVN